MSGEGKIPWGDPRVALLKEKIAEKLGRPVNTPRDFDEVAYIVARDAKEHISESTIKRIYKKNLAYPNVSIAILNVLSKSLGYTHFTDFCDYLSSSGIKDSELTVGIRGVKVNDLVVGDRVRISWYSDRQCCLKYLGDNRFVVEEVENASISKGDTFSCTSFVEGRCLYVDDLVTHDGKVYDSYAMGKTNGLLCVKKL